MVDGRLFKEDVADTLLGTERSVGGVLFALLPVHDVDEPCNDKARGGSCV